MTQPRGDASEYLLSRGPVTLRRQARWGDCDPAGVVYTPRFADYAVSAFEHLLAELLGGPMHSALAGRGLGLPLKALSFEFHRSIWPAEYVDMAVHVAAIRNRTFDLLIHARHQDGQRCFTVSMTPIFVQTDNRSSVPIPADIRQVLEHYATRFGPGPEGAS